jgi:hypothetical protein
MDYHDVTLSVTNKVLIHLTTPHPTAALSLVPTRGEGAVSGCIIYPDKMSVKQIVPLLGFQTG